MRFIPAAFVFALSVLAAAASQSTRQRNGTAIPIVKHSRLVNDDKTVNFDALDSHFAFVKAKIHRGFDNFERNTGTKHRFAPKEVDKRGYANPLAAHSNVMWFGLLGIGTPSILYLVVFDTGSSDLILPGATCDSTCSNHHLYDPSSSSTAYDKGWTFTIWFGGGASVSGEEYTDTVAIGDYEATAQTFGAATQYSSVFQLPQFPADGLMGMAFQSISAFDASPVFQTLVSEGQVTDPVFSFQLSISNGGELYVGGTNPALYTGDFSYVPTTEQGFWQVNMDDLQANDQTMVSNVAAIVDTGTTFIVGPPAQVSTILIALGGQPAPADGYYIFPCDSFPNISLSFGGTPFPIPALTLNLGPAWTNSSDCVIGIIGQMVGASLWVIGDVFLQGVYTTFDVGNSRVGFAHLA